MSGGSKLNSSSYSSSGSNKLGGISPKYSGGSFKRQTSVEEDNQIRLPGSKGDPGPIGPTGPTGEAGSDASMVGPTGSTGVGITGATGTGIDSITLVSGDHSAGTLDTYEILYTDGNTSAYQVYNGDTGPTGVGVTGAKGDTGTYVTGPTGEVGATGTGIDSVTLVSGDHSANTLDTYEILYTNGNTSTYQVYNGDTGPIGSESNVPGPTGPTGIGITGATGADHTGPTGEVGATGATGPVAMAPRYLVEVSNGLDVTDRLANGYTAPSGWTASVGSNTDDLIIGHGLSLHCIDVRILSIETTSDERYLLQGTVAWSNVANTKNNHHVRLESFVPTVNKNLRVYLDFENEDS